MFEPRLEAFWIKTIQLSYLFLYVFIKKLSEFVKPEIISEDVKIFSELSPV